MTQRKPLTRGPLLAVEEHPGALRLVVVGAEGADAQLTVPCADLASGLPLGLERARAQGLHVPKRAILLSGRVTALCLELPPLGEATLAEVERLVRFELEPLLPEGGPGGAACAWADPTASGGPLLTCGVSVEERAQLAARFRAAGLQLVGLYPRLGNAAALLPSTAGSLLEASGDALALVQLEGDRIQRLRTVQPGSQQSALEELRGLLAAPLFVAGELEPAVLEDLRLDFPQLTPLAEGQPAGAVGAARHARARAGGERLAGLPASAPRALPWKQPTLLGVVVLALVALGVVSLDLRLERWRGQAEQALRAREHELDLAEQHETARQQLAAERDALEAELAPLRAVATRRRAAGARAAALSDLLVTLAQASGGVALDRCDDRTGEVTVEGLAGTSAQAEGFLSALEAALAPRGLTLSERQIERTAEGFRFSASYAGVPLAPPETTK